MQNMFLYRLVHILHILCIFSAYFLSISHVFCIYFAYILHVEQLTSMYWHILCIFFAYSCICIAYFEHIPAYSCVFLADICNKICNKICLFLHILSVHAEVYAMTSQICTYTKKNHMHKYAINMHKYMHKYAF